MVHDMLASVAGSVERRLVQERRPRKDPIVVMGCKRSGTSLLFNIVVELEHILAMRVPCGQATPITQKGSMSTRG